MPSSYPCPQCSRPTLYSISNPFRPFCSQQCQILDLGAWASQSHRIEGDALGDAEESQGEDWQA